MKQALFALAAILALVVCVAGQTADAYKDDGALKGGLLDPSRLTVHRSLSFGMASSSLSSVQSQSLYSTMLQYKFSAPVTLNLDFSLPIYSSFSPAQNPTASSISSAEYFRNIPLDFALTWKPTTNLQMRFSVLHDPQGGLLSPYYNRGPFFPTW